MSILNSYKPKTFGNKEEKISVYKIGQIERQKEEIERGMDKMYKDRERKRDMKSFLLPDYITTPLSRCQFLQKFLKSFPTKKNL